MTLKSFIWMRKISKAINQKHLNNIHYQIRDVLKWVHENISLFIQLRQLVQKHIKELVYKIVLLMHMPFVPF